jgi:hypothetical protein
MYISRLRRLRYSVKRKRPEKWRINSWFLFHDNAPAHRSILAKDFLAKYNVTTLEHTPYSPDLDPTLVYLFILMESILKGRSSCDATDIIKNAEEELKRLSQTASSSVFKSLQSLADAHICTRGLFWKKCRLKDCIVLYFSEMKLYREW